TPYTVIWNNGETTEDIDSLVAGVYIYTITDANGCEISGSITLTEPDGLSSSMVLSDYNEFNISCFGLADGSIDLTVNDGTAPYSFDWSNGETTEDLTGLPVGNYIVVVTDANGCTHTDSVILTEPTQLVLNPIDTTLISCNNELDGTFTVEATGGVPAYGYAWSDGQTGPIAQDLGAGFYTAVVTDLNGCQDSVLFEMIEPNVLEAAVVQVLDVTCFGESNGLADVSVTGGTAPYSYDWSDNSTNEDLNGVPAGTYSLEVTDANGCTDTLSLVVNEPTQLMLAIDTVINTTCSGANNGEVTVSASGGTQPYIYSWPSINQSGPTATGLGAGTYEVEVLDANGCLWSMNVSVTQPVSIEAQVNVQSDVSCNGMTDGSAEVIVAGGTSPYTYLWSNNGTDSIVSGLGGGSHSVTVTDAMGCDTTLLFEIVEPEVLALDWDTIFNVTCYGFTNGQLEVEVAGGTLPYEVTWSNGDVGLISDNLSVGEHTAYITDGNGCMDSLSIFVTQPDTIQVIQHSTTMVTCNGGNDGEATVLVNGGTPPFSYHWPFIGQTGNTATALEAGWYTFVATDQNGCTYTDSIQITEPGPILVTTTADTAVCPGNGVTITASATGGAGNYS
ncbi:MAG: SprB repeat-containing protein, partial [Flavobacteriales bacterium]|nr:SprB repeat-containing protein [Flavobacteriales bacterium]